MKHPRRSYSGIVEANFNHGTRIDDLLSRLQGVRQCGKAYRAICPAHQGKSASLCISVGKDNRILLHCHAGCETHAVVAAIGMEMRDLFPKRMSPAQRTQHLRRKLEKAYDQELLIVEIANNMVKSNALSEADMNRLALAHERIKQMTPQMAALDHSTDQPMPPASMLMEVPLANVMSTPPESVRFIVSPWIPRRHVTLLGGHGGIGKSTLALAICAHVACGKAFADLEVEQSTALFVSLEDEPSIVRLHLRQIIETYQLPAQLVLTNLRLLDGTQGNSALMRMSDDHNAEPTSTKALDELLGHAKGTGLIVIDNASDAFDANENSRRSVRAFIRTLASIARHHNAAVVLLSHIDKAAAKGNAYGNNYSGSTAWHNSARSRLALIKEGNLICLAHEKANLSATAPPTYFKLDRGIPLLTTNSPNDDPIQQAADRDAIMLAMQAAQIKGINVPAGLAPGSHSAMSALKPLSEYTRVFQGAPGNRRAAEAITTLVDTGHIRREEYKTEDRKTRARLVLGKTTEDAT